MEWYQQSGSDLCRAENQGEIKDCPDTMHFLWGGGNAASTYLSSRKERIPLIHYLKDLVEI